MKRIAFILCGFLTLFSCSPQEQVIPISDITISQPSAQMAIGEKLQLSAIITPSTATDKKVVWTSSNERVAAVNQNGTVEALAKGTSTITATAGGMTAMCAVEVTPVVISCTTIGADNISAVSVVLSGKAHVGSTMSSNFEMGIIYSKEATLSISTPTKIKATKINSDNSYSIGITHLDPGSTYYFCSYAINEGIDSYGETKVFTTKALSSLIKTYDPVEVTATSSILEAKLNLSDVQYNKITYGFYWGKEKSINALLVGSSPTNNTFQAILSSLSQLTKYWYQAFVEIDGVIYYGDEQFFTTGFIPVKSVILDRTNVVLNKGEAITLSTTIYPSDAILQSSIIWSSSDVNIASVDQNGMVRAINPGNAIITASVDGCNANCTVTVINFNGGNEGIGEEIWK